MQILEMQRAGMLMSWCADTYPDMKSGEFLRLVQFMVQLERDGLVVWMGGEIGEES